MAAVLSCRWNTVSLRGIASLWLFAEVLDAQTNILGQTAQKRKTVSTIQFEPTPSFSAVAVTATKNTKSRYAEYYQLQTDAAKERHVYNVGRDTVGNMNPIHFHDPASHLLASNGVGNYWRRDIKHLAQLR